MAVSGSQNFNQTRDEIIKDSLMLLGVVHEDEVVHSSTENFAARMLNKLVKSWSKLGVNMWTSMESTKSVINGTASYSLTSPTGIRRVIDVRYDDTSTTTRLVRLSRTDYYANTNLATTGTPTSYYVDEQRDNPTVYLYPVPTNSNHFIDYTYIKAIDDFDASTDNPDLPQEWLECLTYNLAVKIAPAFGKYEAMKILKPMADEMLQAMKENDVLSDIKPHIKNTIVKDALLLIDALNAKDFTDTRPSETDIIRMVQQLIQSWDARGINLWSYVENTDNLTTNQVSQALTGSNVSKITEVRLELGSGQGIKQLVELSRGEYFGIEDRLVAASGVPRVYYVDYQNPDPTLYVYPAPDGTDTFYYSGVERLTVSASDPAVDIPDEYLQAVVYNLAVQLAPAFGKEDKIPLIQPTADRLLLEVIEKQDKIFGDSFKNKVLQDAASLLDMTEDIRTMDRPTEAKFSRALNRTLQYWDSLGLHLWQYTENSQALVQGTTSYTLTDVKKVTEARIRSSGTDTKLVELDRAEYYAIATKTTQGTPTQFYVDYQAPDPTIYLYPTPSSATPTLEYSATTRVTDFDIIADVTPTIDIPEEWEYALVYNVAAMLAPMFNKDDKALLLKETADRLLLEIRASVDKASSHNIKNDIIKDTLALLDVFEDDKWMNKNTESSIARSLDRMLQAWNANGLHLWKYGEGAIVLDNDTVSYTLATASDTNVAAAGGFIKAEIGSDEAAAQTTITVDSSTGMAASDVIFIELDDGTLDETTISSVTNSTTIVIADGLTSAASDGNHIYVYTTADDSVSSVDRVEQVRVRGSDGNDRVLTEISRSDYYSISNKTNESSPTSFYIDYQKTNPVLYLWPEPDSLKEYLFFTYVQNIDAYDVTTGTLDLPNEWQEAIVYNLAVRIAPMFNKEDKVLLLKPLADEYLDLVQSYDNEPVDVDIYPEMY